MTLKNTSHRLAVPAAFASALALAACGGPPPPTAQIYNARAAIARAQDDGAVELSAQPLQMAQAKLAQAQTETKNDHNDQAARLAEQAQVDADYAAASANAQKAEHTASELHGAQQRLDRRLDQPR